MNIINIFDTISVEQKYLMFLSRVDWNARAQNAGPKLQQ